MIVVRLMGGLGNQMFQYAAGKALAERLNVQLLLDRTFLDQKPVDAGYTLRDFELDVFKIEAGIAGKSLVRKMRRGLTSRWYRKSSHIFPFLFPDPVFYETQKPYMKAIEELHGPVYMEGYWQSEKYFLSIKKELQEKYFIPVAPASGLNAELLDRIKSSPTISMHVRRGDYVNVESSNKYHGTCSVTYYERAAKLLAEKTGVKQFFIFSDEPDWVKENISLPYHTTYISHNKGRESYWDLHLMRHCKHHIIANSSFSWWGAWLNPSRSKVVIAPKNWFSDPSASDNEIIPEGWIKS
jgi:hypothetical protein